MTDLEQITYDNFSGIVGEQITVAATDASIKMKIDNVKLHSQGSMRDSHVEIDGRTLPPRRAFTLTLEGPRDPLLPQGNYEMDFPGHTRMVLFMAPFRQEHDCTLYEIIFA